MQPESLILPEAEHYTAQFSKNRLTLPGDGLAWLQEKRRSGMARFAQSGFPRASEEDWKYTSLKTLTNKTFSLVGQDIQPLADFEQVPYLHSYQIVFVDGRCVSTPPAGEGGHEIGIQILTLSQCLNESPEWLREHFGKAVEEGGHGLTQLNNGMHEDGVVIIIEDNATIKVPVEIVFISRHEGALIQPRSLIVAKQNSKAQIIERHISNNNNNDNDNGEASTLCTFTNGVTEFILHQGAQMDYFMVQTASASAYQVSGVWVKQHRNSRFNSLTFTLGGALVRNDLRVKLCESGAHCDMLGVYSLAGKQHTDNHTTIEHIAPSCSSRELYKGVLNGRSRGVFHGRIKVHKDAQQTDAQQSNNTLILSRNAEIDSKPQLEIYADDVKCSHGATIGQMDENALFYLRCRGITEADARSMLTAAFVSEVIKEVQIEPLKNYLESLLSSKRRCEN